MIVGSRRMRGPDEKSLTGDRRAHKPRLVSRDAPAPKFP